MTLHLNVRVAWHDDKWSGRVCKKPTANAFCVDLDRIREQRDDTAEAQVAGMPFAELNREQLPPCIAEGGAFMSDREWVRTFQHPYQDLKKAAETHGMLHPTLLRVPPYSSFATPFLRMLRDNQEEMELESPTPLPPDDEPPFSTPWVFGRERQEALGERFFGRLTPGSSLVFFYTKSGHPLSEAHSRLVVGVGRIESIAKLTRYESTGGTSYPIWDRLFSHSIRHEGADGLLLPYHDYLAATGDPGEDDRRKALLEEIAVVPQAGHIRAFSYAAEHSTPDVALSTLVACLEAVRTIQRHGIAKGPWAEREEWLNAQIAQCWADRGAFPGTGAALEALGMRLGTCLVYEVLAKGLVSSDADPWPHLIAMIEGREAPPQEAYEADLHSVRKTWERLPEERRSLLRLLSRFSLSQSQASRWFLKAKRDTATRSPVTDGEIIANPYRIVETDLGDTDEYPVSMGTVDRGVMPDPTVEAKHPLPEDSRVTSPTDVRRVRAGIVTVLREAERQGDSLLTASDALTRLAALDLARPCAVSVDWLRGNNSAMVAEVTALSLNPGDPTGTPTECLQLATTRSREEKLASLLSRRAAKALPSLGEDWGSLLSGAITRSGGTVDLANKRHAQALAEQAVALERVTTRRLGVLVGRAGTGKTTVLGALLESAKLAANGVLFLAPTGKARVRITQKTKQKAMTVAQFLYQLGRYDGPRQRPLFDGKEQYRKEHTVVIDECSMLTLEDMLAVLLALDLGHVERLILVGDPNQLPPIGVGRPFADTVAWLDSGAEKSKAATGALGRLTVELRTAAGAPSDTLRLASWYTREQQPVDADRVLSDLELGKPFNDLTLCFWKSPEDLRARLLEQLSSRLGLSGPDDIVGFNRALGLTDEGWVPFDDHDGAERFQILSPVRLHPHGVHDLNRFVQRSFRWQQLKASREHRAPHLGDEEIVYGDKVILVRNGKTKGWGKRAGRVEEYLANGEIGVGAVAYGEQKGKALNVAFAGRPDVRFGYWPSRFTNGDGPLQLAYALTVHKAQGSEFGTVFMVVPKESRLLTRELLYTALTRARDHLVLLIEGNDASFLYDLTRPERSETARRNSNLFSAGVRHEVDNVPFAEYLIHRTTRGELVRSKSELVIANHLHGMGLDYHYERKLPGTKVPGAYRPDFSFVDDAGDLIVWEHLGMLNNDEYREAWTRKREWYLQNGYIEGETLFTTSEEHGLDMNVVDAVAKQVKLKLS